MRFIDRLGPLKPFILFATISLVLLALMRVALVTWQWPRVAAADGLWPVMGLGLRMDVLFLCMLLVLPVMASLLIPGRLMATGVYRALMGAYLTLSAILMTVMEGTTPAYISYFDVRPSRIFFEYLVHPLEVAQMLAKGFPVTLVVSSIVLVLIVVWLWRQLAAWFASAHAWPYRWRLAAVLPVFLLMLLGGRSSLGHRPANVSTVAFSNDQLVNELALNSSYTLAYAIYRLRHEGDPANFYPSMAETEIIRRIRRLTGAPEGSFVSADVPTLRGMGVQGETRRNLVIVLEESMGAQFVGSLGGLPLTPELDALSAKGLYLTRLYATGIRSARGIEAVVTGFPPTPARSVLKLGLSQRGFYSIGRTLEAAGYRGYFIYGGESHFDNMRGFLVNNGFSNGIDQKDFERPTFRGSWGVSDEDLFDKAHQLFEQQDGEPFFALVFSSSFHSPFEFPDGRIELYDEEKNSKHNALKYADYALGQFFRKARASSYWHNTVFLVVADHDERVRGAALVPIGNFHIPGLIIGPGVEPARYDKIASQIDLAPTLLHLMGVEAKTPMVGRNLLALHPNDPGRAIMQSGNNHAYMVGDMVLIHQPLRPPQQFRYAAGELRPIPKVNAELAADALAIALWPGIAYAAQQYRLP